jgi:hypothetical protein
LNAQVKYYSRKDVFLSGIFHQIVFFWFVFLWNFFLKIEPIIDGILHRRHHRRSLQLGPTGLAPTGRSRKSAFGPSPSRRSHSRSRASRSTERTFVFLFIYLFVYALSVTQQVKWPWGQYMHKKRSQLASGQNNS